MFSIYILDYTHTSHYLTHWSTSEICLRIKAKLSNKRFKAHLMTYTTLQIINQQNSKIKNIKYHYILYTVASF